MRDFSSPPRYVSRVGLAAATVTAVLLVLVAQSAMAIADDAAGLPGGKAHFVVSQASLVAESRDNDARLANYEFATDGTVSSTGWHWSQSQPTERERTGALPDESCTSADAPGSGDQVQQCYILTAAGFTGSGDDSRAGSYTVDGDTLDIVWDDGDTESWTFSLSDDESLVKMDLADSTISTHGFAYGSNADASTRVDMATMPDHPEPLTQDMYTWANDTVGEAVGGTLAHSEYQQCEDASECVTYLQPESQNACQHNSGCPNYGGGTDADVSSIQYYMQEVSPNDRRDTFWHWCSCLALERDETCYKGNSHVKPMLQIIDDDGGFHGWVGAEASFYPGSDDPRGQDMLAAFRIADF